MSKDGRGRDARTIALRGKRRHSRTRDRNLTHCQAHVIDDRHVALAFHRRLAVQGR